MGTYLQEEIRAEGLTRSIENFSRFLELAGLTSGEQINFTAVAHDAGVPPRTVREHYQILEDTLVGHPASGLSADDQAQTSRHGEVLLVRRWRREHFETHRDD